MDKDSHVKIREGRAYFEGFIAALLRRKIRVVLFSQLLDFGGLERKYWEVRSTGSVERTKISRRVKRVSADGNGSSRVVVVGTQKKAKLKKGEQSGTGVCRPEKMARR